VSVSGSCVCVCVAVVLCLQVREIVAENPELLIRMDYYMNAPMLDYLPIEIQNMMVLTGQGLSEFTTALLCV